MSFTLAGGRDVAAAVATVLWLVSVVLIRFVVEVRSGRPRGILARVVLVVGPCGGCGCVPLGDLGELASPRWVVEGVAAAAASVDGNGGRSESGDVPVD